MKFFAITSSFLAVALMSVQAASTSTKYISYTQDERGTPMAHIQVDMASLFETPANLTGFNLDIGQTNYDSTFYDKVSQDLSSDNFEDKVNGVISALYAKPYEQGADEGMDEDFHRLSSMAHPDSAKSLIARNNPYVSWAKSHAIALTTCSAFLSCISGTTCSFYVTVNKAPRSRCETQGGENCCMSWSDYTLQAGFFRATWTTCYNSRPDNNESCEGHDNGSGQGGDVCFSNRSTGCT